MAGLFQLQVLGFCKFRFDSACSIAIVCCSTVLLWLKQQCCRCHNQDVLPLTTFLKESFGIPLKGRLAITHISVYSCIVPWLLHGSVRNICRSLRVCLSLNLSLQSPACRCTFRLIL